MTEEIKVGDTVSIHTANGDVWAEKATAVITERGFEFEVTENINAIRNGQYVIAEISYVGLPDGWTARRAN